MPKNGYFDTVFAVDGELTTVPDATQTNGSVSYTQGFGILYSTLTENGGYDFPRAAHNQLLNDITSALQQYQQNGIPPFITTSMNNGSPYSYAANAVVLSSGVAYQSLANSNTDTPPSAKWKTLNANSTQSVTGANHTYAVGDNNLLTLRSNSGTLMVDTLPGTSPGILGNYWQGTIENNDASALLQLTVGSGANLNGSSSGTIILGPGQRCTVFSDGSNYWVKDGAAGRTRLGANTTLYVSTSGSDSNNGLASATPWATLTHAYNWCQDNLDLAGFNITVQLATGTYTSGLVAQGPLVGWANVNSFTVLGNTGSPDSYVISTTNANAIFANIGAKINIEGVKLTTATSGYPMLAQSPGTIIFFSNVDFGAAPISQVFSQLGGSISAQGNYTISAGAEFHLNAAQFSMITTDEITVTLTGTPAFSGAFVSAFASGFVESIGTTYSGSATGSRYSAGLAGGINTNAAGASYFPGSSPGSAASPGYYN